jgi:hypothetical protein
MPALVLTCLVAALGGGRPTLSGPAEVFDTDDGRFRIHFTRAGGDAVGGGADGDGVPDAVRWAAEGFARVWAEFVDVDGWPVPPGDGGLGGSDHLDVYLRDLDANGYAHGEPVAAGTSCWMELDPGVATGLGRVTFTSVAAHELHHCLQFAITTGRLSSWIYEATSTYAQYVLYGDQDDLLDLARELLWRLRLSGSASPLDATGQQFEYAGMTWIKYLVDRAGGDRTVVRALWQAMSDAGTWDAGHGAALPAAVGVPSLDAAAIEFATWNWFACDRDDGRHYADDPARCALDGRVRAAVVDAVPAAGDSPALGRWGAGYVSFRPDCATADVRIEVTPTAPMRLALIEVATPEVSPVVEIEAAAGVPVTFDALDWGWRRRVVLVGAAGAAGGSFSWSASGSGAYAPPPVAPPVVAVTIVGDGPLALTVGDRIAIAAEATTDTCAPAAAAITWTTDDPAVAIVDGDEVVAIAPGRARIVARAGGVDSAPRVVEVVDVPGDGAAGCGCAAGGGAGSGLGLVLVAVAGRPRRGARRFVARRG